MTVFEDHQEQFLIDSVEINGIATSWFQQEVVDVVEKIEGSKDYFCLLEKKELIQGILSFWQERGYLSKKQKWCLCWAIGEITQRIDPSF